MSGAATAASAGSRVLAVSITGGGADFGFTHMHTFDASLATVTGASGGVTYAWSLTEVDGDTETWDFTGQGTSAMTPTVRGSFAGGVSSATAVCTVTDNVTGASAVSNTVTFRYINTA
ncbi:MAG TPA: hypothetical protein VG939_11175 [Caulobacteraceae bacterium]|nr:hypothetical protein [Caulobacteraceae bacterium]